MKTGHTHCEKLLIRADASTQIGIGHVMRCLALAQAWQDWGGETTFLMAPEIQVLEDRLKLEGMDVELLSAPAGIVEDARQTVTLARHVGASWAVVDGYHFTSEYQRMIKDSGLRLVLIDDVAHAEHYWADILLNQNFYAHEHLYSSREPYTRLLLGCRYVLLRREFLRWREWKREIPEMARNMLVTMGGGDPNNVTLKVIKALKKVDVSDLNVKIVVGRSNPHIETLQGALLSAPCPMLILQNVKNMPELMAWADMAVTAGGSTCWELAFIGVPSITVVSAENQQKVAESLDKEGIFKTVGWWQTTTINVLAAELAALIRDKGLREKKIRMGQQLTDGDGAGNVVDALTGGSAHQGIAFQRDRQVT